MAKQISPQDKKMAKQIFSVRLHEAMQKRALTQAQLAEAAGCTQSAISDYLKGRIPSGEILVALALSLGTTAEALIGKKEMRVSSIGAEWQHRALSAEEKLTGLKAAMSAWLKKI